MNIKYDKLSIIGKIWTIGELLNMGIYENKQAYMKAVFRKLSELNDNPNIFNYRSMLDSTLENIIHNAFAMKQRFVDNIDVSVDFMDDGSIVSAIWFNRQLFDYFKLQLKENNVSLNDIKLLNDAYLAIRRIYAYELKNKQLCSKERVELFKIFKEIEDFKIKVELKLKHGEIELN